MVKTISILILLTFSLFANSSCVSCHEAKKINSRKVFMQALLVYGGEKNFKTALFYYCKNPTQTSSVMDEEFLERYLPLKASKIGNKSLEKLINQFWNNYKIKGNLK